jgi:outer membrane immunogenic protein
MELIMRKYLFAALVAGTIATPAFAQDAPNLSGFHVEGIVGYDRPNVDNANGDGILYGVGAGYDFQSGNAVFGIEGEASDSTAHECATGTIVVTDQLCARSGRDLYVGGRVGAVVGGRTLLYVKAGYTNARIGLDYNDGTAATLNDFSLHENLDGVRVGAGAQFAIGTNAFLKTEYRYSNYQDGFDRHQVVAGVGFRF